MSNTPLILEYSPVTVQPSSRVAGVLFLMVVAVVCLEYAGQIINGMYARTPIAWMLGGFVVFVFAMMLTPPRKVCIWAKKNIGAIFATAITLHLVWLVTYPSVTMTLGGRADYRLFMSMLVVVCCGSMAALMPWFVKRHFGMVIALFGILTIWTVRHTPDPWIDTFPMQQEASAALLKGENPFAITFKNVYPDNTPFYPPGLTQDGRVLYGYGYPPVTLLMVAPSYGLFGDHRFGQAAALIGVAAFMAFAGGRMIGLWAAGLWMSTPRMWEVLTLAWTEPLVLVLLAATVYAAARKRWWLPWIFGVFLVSKQHMVLFAPAALLLMPRPWNWRYVLTWYGKAAVMGIAITLPFVLWDVRAFWHSVVSVQLGYPARADSLSFPSFFMDAYDWKPPRFVSVALVPFCYLIAWWKFPRNAVGFALAVALVCFVFFAFDQAFLNRQFMIITTIYLAIAVLPVMDAKRRREPEVDFADEELSVRPIEDHHAA